MGVDINGSSHYGKHAFWELTLVPASIMHHSQLRDTTALFFAKRITPQVERKMRSHEWKAKKVHM